MSATDAAERIRELGAWLSGTDIALLELRTPAETIRLVRPGGGPGGAVPTPVAEAPAVTVRAPAPGVFLPGHPVRAEPLAPPGATVRVGDPVALLRTGALLLHVVAPVDGTVLDVVASEGEVVGHGTPLLHLQGSAAP